MSEKINVGDEVFQEEELRSVAEIIRNNRGDPVISWVSTRSEGTCIPGLWNEWKASKESKDYFKKQKK